VSLALLSGIFAAIYKILPDTPLTWNDVIIGAVATALMITIGKMAIGIYLGSTAVTSSFGAAGSVLASLLWVYYSAQIFLYGAEFTRAFSDMRTKRRVPAREKAPAR
jgi:membrane protein